jgi:hypothetical protein
MKKITLLLFGILTLTNCYSQEMHFETGSNFTQYVFRSSNGSSSTQSHSGSGTVYKIGFSKTLNKDLFSYELGLSLNEYNAIAGSSSNSYKWNTSYLGLQNTIGFVLLKKNNFKFFAQVGFNFSTIIFGKQEINGIIYDLKSQDEFAGLILIPSAGLQSKYKWKDYGHLSLSYNFSKSISPFNATDEKLSFKTNQILFGIHLNINNK